MSNEISLFQQAVPDYVKQVELDDLTKALGGGGGGKRISIRGGVFRMVVGSEEVAKNVSRSMNIVVVNGTKHTNREFYLKKYTPGDNEAPDCWSNDGVTPDASIEEPQNHNCESCPQNIKGAGENGNRACRYKKYLAITLADDIGGSVYQLTLPSKSHFGKGDQDHMPFEQYAKYVSSQGYNINMLVTEMKFDSDSDNPKLTFRPVGFLSKEQWEIAKAQGQTPDAKNAVVRTGVKTEPKQKALEAPTPVAVEVAEPTPEPTKRSSKKTTDAPTEKPDLASVMAGWVSDDD